MDHLLRPIISGLIGAAVCWLLMRWVMNQKAMGDPDARIVQYGKGMKGVLAFMAAIVAFMDYAALQSREDQHVPAALVAGSLTSMLVYFALEVFCVKIEMGDDTIRLKSPWRKPREIPWSDIEDYQWSNTAQWHIFHSKNHGKIRVSPYMDGAKAFVKKAFAVLKEKYPERFVPPSPPESD